MAITDRRGFLRSMGAFSLGACLAPMQKPLRWDLAPNAHYDVVIIGAGISGLQAAYALQKRGRQRVLVLEARDRVGGRTLNQASAGGGYVELGGQWVGPTQDSVLGLMSHLNIAKFETYRSGRDIDDGTGGIGAGALLDYIRAVAKLDRLSKRVPLDAPWSAAQASQWDRMTVRDWMDANMFTQGGKDLIETTVETSIGGSSDKVSFLWFLFYIHSGTDFDTMSERAQRWRIEGGSQVISLELANRLGPKVVTSAVVDGVKWSTQGARIQYNGTEQIAAKKLIVAMMPADVQRIRFFPALPAQRAHLQSAWGASAGDKYFCVYPGPFWRQAGLSGQATSESEFIGYTWDNSPNSGNPGVLGGFANLEGAHRPPTRAERRQATVDSFVKFFGAQAAQPISYHEYSWGDDPLTEGCVSPLRPQVLTTLGPALREPVGPIHWAGTESSAVWCGYMDGAVRAGLRSAEEVDLLLP